MSRTLNYSLGLFGLLLAVAYWPGIVGAASTPRWLVLGAAAFIAAWMISNDAAKRDTAFPWAPWLGGMFVVWSIITALWSPAPEAFDACWKLILLGMLFVAGARIADLGPLLIGAAAGVGLSSALVVLDRLGLIAYAQALAADGGALGPSGLFGNGLYLAEFAAMVAVGLLALGHWRWALLCAPSILLVTLPRGPLVALAVAGICWLWLKGRVWMAGEVMALAAGGLAAAIWLRPSTALDRLETWTDLLGKLVPFGHGLGSYASGAPLLDAMTRKLHANNDLLEIAYETGGVGLALALAFMATLLWGGRQAAKARDFDSRIAGSSPALPAKLVLIVFLVEGLFGFPLHMPATAGLFALVAGHLARDIPMVSA